MTDEIPNFRGSYPLAGERIGPAWRAIWALLGSPGGEWVSYAVISAAVLKKVDIKEASVKTLLSQAGQVGLIEKRYGRSANNRIMLTHVRIKREEEDRGGHPGREG